MGFRNLNASIKKLTATIEKQRKAKLKALTAYQWLMIMRDEYIKRTNQSDDFTIVDSNVTMNKAALNFSIIYQSENTRLMNPVARKEVKSLLKNIEKKLESV